MGVLAERLAMFRRLGLFVAMVPLPALAQNTSGVPGPGVTEGASAADYRLAVSSGDGRGTRAAHRVQYERAISTRVRWRVVAQALTSDGDARPEYVQADLQWQATPDGGPLQAGLRFDARLQDASRPERLGAVAMASYAITETLTVGGSVHVNREIGDLARDGVTIETRGSMALDLGRGRSVGIEAFHDHGRTPDPEPFEGRQQIGPFIILPVAAAWAVDASALFGLSDETQALDLRLFITREF